MKEAYLAIDFGGGSGRVIAGYLSGDGLQLDTVHRFPIVRCGWEDIFIGIFFLCLKR